MEGIARGELLDFNSAFSAVDVYCGIVETIRKLRPMLNLVAD